MRFSLLLLFASLLCGCSTYNYDILQPESAHLRITTSDWQTLPSGPVSYHFRAVESHLVIQIYNTTSDPLRLLGDRSYIVTPSSQSIPLDTQTIAPGAFAKLILPPVQPIIHTGPAIGIGFGYSTGRVYRAYPEDFYNPAFAEPRMLYVETPANYWEWDGETNVTLHLVFDQSGKTVGQTFVFHRVKL